MENLGNVSSLKTKVENSKDLKSFWRNKFIDLFPYGKREQRARSTKTCTLILPDGKKCVLPVEEGVMGAPCIDIGKLFAETGYLTLDPGFMSTASCISSITYIDGNNSKLLYRGYSIESLAEFSDFEEITYLLLYGDLPTESQKAQHDNLIRKNRLIHEKLIRFYSGFHYDAHPMAIMLSVVGALSAFYHDSLDIKIPENRQMAVYRMLAKIPTIAAFAYKTSIGQPMVYPLENLNYVENFMYMMFSIPTRKFEIDPLFTKALEVLFIIQADHEQNASTSTVRLAGSSLANPFACISSGIVALWGPAHGGASESVINMLIEIGSVENIDIFLSQIKDKNNSKRLMGFGHRVYKSYDPRAKIMKSLCHKLIGNVGNKDRLLEIALKLEEKALADPYFKSRNLFPNVDFYSGLVLRAIGIPVSMFTVLFAVARTAGWISHWKEMIESPDQRIGRPRQLYEGTTERVYEKISSRRK